MLRVPTRHGTSTRRKWACLLAALAFLLVRVPGILDGGSEAAGGGFDDDAEDGVPFLRGPRCTPDGTCLRTAFIQGHNARRLLTQGLAGSVPWQLVQRPEDATLFWMRNRDKRAEAVAAGDGGRVFNKIPARWQVADKALLAANVHAFLRSNGLSDSPLPETVPLVTVADMNTLSKKAAAMPGIWIVKMTSESMGRGIEIVTDMAAWVRSPTFSNVAAEVLKGERFVCQKYVTNPLLLNGRKSECRLYWLLASVNPMIVAVFHEGQVRLNSMPYQNHSFDNPMIHLTNVHQQRDHPEFEQMLKEGKLKWSMTRWKEYLVAEMKVKPEVADGLLVRMKWSLVRVVNATTDLLRLDTHSK
ncbi:putative alpha-tubulin polyglutamylase Ttll1 [Diplonema papillatum]|nr:putative alpha-tubulin polyglutamylase Ttll1 [Diplonema papillatum]